MQILDVKKRGSKSGFGRVLGSIWEEFGTVWAVFWALVDAFRLFFGRSKSYLFEALVQDELQEAFRMDFGSILEGSGRILEGFGSILDRFWMVLGGFG